MLACQHGLWTNPWEGIISQDAARRSLGAAVAAADDLLQHLIDQGALKLELLAFAIVLLDPTCRTHSGMTVGFSLRRLGFITWGKNVQLRQIASMAAMTHDRTGVAAQIIARQQLHCLRADDPFTGISDEVQQTIGGAAGLDDHHGRMVLRNCIEAFNAAVAEEITAARAGLTAVNGKPPIWANAVDHPPTSIQCLSIGQALPALLPAASRPA